MKRFVIMGCGRVGATLAKWLDRDGYDVTIIDRDPNAFTRLGHDFTKRGKTVSGDGIDEDVLRRAGIEGADGFAAVTEGDNRNIMAAQIAQIRFKVPNVICRIYDPERQETYNGLGLNSISPTIIGARFIKDALLPPGAGRDSEDHTLASGSSVPRTRLDNPAPANPADPSRDDARPAATATRPPRL
ncbi:MAG TPA: TrkA family potassium uptake protein [Ktedonobacterales bacterium]